MHKENKCIDMYLYNEQRQRGLPWGQLRLGGCDTHMTHGMHKHPNWMELACHKDKRIVTDKLSNIHNNS